MSEPLDDAARADAVEDEPGQLDAFAAGAGSLPERSDAPPEAETEAVAAVEAIEIVRELPDRAARDRIAGDLDTNLLVEAGAGAGKTTALVDRMVALVRSGRATVDRIAAVTFTRKAAAELRERFQTALERELRATHAAGDAKAARIADRALRDIDRAFIGTIHSFCARLLRERPLDAGLDPGFRETQGAEELRLRREFWHAHLERLAATGDPCIGALAGVGLRPAQLLKLFEELSGHPDVDFPADAVPRPDPAPARAELERLLERAMAILPKEEPPGGWDPLQIAIRRLSFRRRVLGWSDDIRFLQALSDALSAGPRVRTDRWGERGDPVIDEARQLGEAFNSFAEPDGAGGRVLRQWYAHRYPIVLDFALRAAKAFEVERRRAGTLFFQDLLMLSARLLRESPNARAELGARFRYLLVDEFQDTDPVQAEVLMLLAAEASPAEGSPPDWRAAVPRPGALFVVGDPKQSIYRFRRADVTLYNQVKTRFRSFGDVLELTANFRSHTPVETIVNTVFRRLFPPEATPEQAPFTGMRVQKPDVPGQRVAWYAAGGRSRARHEELAELEAPRIASFIEQRVKSGECQPGDFLILTHRKRLIGLYARAIEARNLPVQVTGAGVMIETELQELKLLLDALADPGDATLTLSVLVGLFFGLDYEQLTEHVVDRGRSLTFTTELDEPLSEVDLAIDTLREFWLLSRREPADVVVARIVDTLGLLPFAAAGELGASRAGALLYILDAVREAALDGRASLTDAVEAIAAAMDAQEAEAPLEPGRRDVVRIMNIHQAKGLEAPVVLLAEPFGEWRPEPSIHIVRPEHGRAAGRVKVTERTFRVNDTTLAAPLDWETHAAAEQAFEDAERDRLLYVAATRAERELIVGTRRGTQGDSPWRRLEPYLETYCERLDLPVKPEPERVRLEATATEMTTAVAAADARRMEARAPGYRTAAVTTRVKGGDDVQVAAPAVPVELRGPEWGTVVHGALEAAGRGASGEALGAICRGLLLAADRPVDENGQPTELAELHRIVDAVTTSPLWTEATSAKALLLEVPFAIAVDAADYAGIVAALPAHAMPAAAAAPVEIIEGVIDLAFRGGDGGWTIVDYKSDAAGSGIDDDRMARYQAQVALYAEAWRRLTGDDVTRTVILFTADGERRETG